MRRPCADREEKRVTRGSAHPARKQEQLGVDGRKQEQLDLDGPNQRGHLDMSTPERSALVKSDRFTSDFAKLAPASRACTKLPRLMLAAEKFAFSRFAFAKFTRHPTALLKSAAERSDPLKRAWLISASSSLARASLEPINSVPLRVALLKTASARSSLLSIRCGFEHPVQ